MGSLLLSRGRALGKLLPPNQLLSEAPSCPGPGLCTAGTLGCRLPTYSIHPGSFLSLSFSVTPFLFLPQHPPANPLSQRLLCHCPLLTSFPWWDSPKVNTQFSHPDPAQNLSMSLHYPQGVAQTSAPSTPLRCVLVWVTLNAMPKQGCAFGG